MTSPLGHTSGRRGISPSPISSLAGDARSSKTPPTSGTDSGTARRNFTSQIHASCHKTPAQVLAHMAVRLPYPAMGCMSGPLLGQERRTLPGTKMGIVLLLMDFVIIWEEILIGAWSCGKDRTHSLGWV